MSFHALIPERLRTSLGGAAIPCVSPLDPPLRAAGSWIEAGPARPSPRQPVAKDRAARGVVHMRGAVFVTHYSSRPIATWHKGSGVRERLAVRPTAAIDSRNGERASEIRRF